MMMMQRVYTNQKLTTAPINGVLNLFPNSSSLFSEPTTTGVYLQWMIASVC